jgi:branched-chain amino acid transport system ATP-binding protein
LALRYADALGRLRAALPAVAILITESSPDLLASLVDETFVIERGEITRA